MSEAERLVSRVHFLYAMIPDLLTTVLALGIVLVTVRVLWILASQVARTR